MNQHKLRLTINITFGCLIIGGILFWLNNKTLVISGEPHPITLKKNQKCWPYFENITTAYWETDSLKIEDNQLEPFTPDSTCNYIQVSDMGQYLLFLVDDFKRRRREHGTAGSEVLERHYFLIGNWAHVQLSSLFKNGNNVIHEENLSAETKLIVTQKIY